MLSRGVCELSLLILVSHRKPSKSDGDEMQARGLALLMIDVKPMAAGLKLCKILTLKMKILLLSSPLNLTRT
jgi:hypothetical protein